MALLPPQEQVFKLVPWWMCPATQAEGKMLFFLREEQTVQHHPLTEAPGALSFPRGSPSRVLGRL